MRAEEARVVQQKTMVILMKNVNDYLKINQVTVYQLAKRTGIANNLIYTFLNFERDDVRLSTICAYAEAMNVSASDLLRPGCFKQKKI